MRIITLTAPFVMLGCASLLAADFSACEEIGPDHSIVVHDHRDLGNGHIAFSTSYNFPSNEDFTPDRTTQLDIVQCQTGATLSVQTRRAAWSASATDYDEADAVNAVLNKALASETAYTLRDLQVLIDVVTTSAVRTGTPSIGTCGCQVAYLHAI